jgi:hypothetical protein
MLKTWCVGNLLAGLSIPSAHCSLAGFGVQVFVSVVVGPVNVTFLVKSTVLVTCAKSCVHVVLVTGTYWLIVRVEVIVKPTEVVDSDGRCVIIFCTKSVIVVWQFWPGGGVHEGVKVG